VGPADGDGRRRGGLDDLVSAEATSDPEAAAAMIVGTLLAAVALFVVVEVSGRFIELVWEHRDGHRREMLVALVITADLLVVYKIFLWSPAIR